VNFVGCVEIKRTLLPSMFDMNSGSDLILDCDYMYNENDFHLVVKWYYNSSGVPIYQWIPERNARHIADLLKGRFDEQFVFGNPNDPYSKYRAIKLKNPTPDLSGKYVCDIASLASQDKRETHLFIYASPKSFDFRYAMNKVTGDLNLECIVTGVYPLPTLSLSQQDPSGKLQPLVDGVERNYTLNGTLYDAILKYTVTEDYLVSATASGLSTKFECNVEIEKASLVRRKRISLYPNPALLTDVNTHTNAMNVVGHSYFVKFTVFASQMLVARTLIN